MSDPFGEVYAWMREPDWIEESSLVWLADWVNRRPLGAMRELADLVPAPGHGIPTAGSGGKET